MTGVLYLASRLRMRLGALARDERGVSAVEFALLLPLMLALYFGTIELSQGISADRKVGLAARTVGDLVTRVPGLRESDMNDVLRAAGAVMMPFPESNLRLTVSSVKIDGDGNATIDWSRSSRGAAHGKGDPVTVRNALVVPNSSLIWSEVEYAYTPLIGYVISGTLTLRDEIFMVPRLSDTVTYPMS